MKNRHAISYIAFLAIFSTTNAHAYFDHGTGSLLIQSIIAFFGMIAVYFYRMKAYLFSFFRKHLFRKELKIDGQKHVETSEEKESSWK
ncbi:MAG: hypothetical protein LCH30_04270 [Proteobacteria bacterium]|nr:hypothetical protein [Pseudomonadota bacterium]